MLKFLSIFILSFNDSQGVMPAAVSIIRQGKTTLDTYIRRAAVKDLLAGIILLLLLIQFVVQIHLERLSKKLFILATGDSRGYSLRGVLKNIETFASSPHKDLAKKVKAFERISLLLVAAAVFLTFFTVAADKFGLI